MAEPNQFGQVMAPSKLSEQMLLGLWTYGGVLKWVYL